MITAGVVSPESNWEPRAVSAAREKIEAKIDKGAHAQALTNLARVLLWAGKKEDAARLAFQASQIPNASEQVQVSSASLLSSLLLDKGERPQAMELLYSTLDKLPGAIEIRLKLGQLLSDPNLHEPEKAIAHLLLVCQQLPEHDSALSSFSLLMAQRGRLDIAFDSASRALQINPKNAKAQIILQRIHEILKDKKIEPMPFQIDLEIYPSKAPRRLIQLRRIAGSQMIPHGVEVEFYESGRLKSYKDLDGGKISGEVKSWDKNGNLL
jgi:tetratricopeptide (TPR) repeat protein